MALKVLLQTCIFLQGKWLDNIHAVQLASETSVLPLQPSVALATGREVEVYTAPVEPRISRRRQETWPTSRAHPACSRSLQNDKLILGDNNDDDDDNNNNYYYYNNNTWQWCVAPEGRTVARHQHSEPANTRLNYRQLN